MSCCRLRAAEAIAAYRLTGKPGETAQVMATIAGQPVSLLLLGVGDRSRSRAAPGRGGAGPAAGRRRLPSTCSVVAGEDSAGIQAFAEGVAAGRLRVPAPVAGGRPADPAPRATRPGWPGCW